MVQSQSCCPQSKMLFFFNIQQHKNNLKKKQSGKDGVFRRGFEKYFWAKRSEQERKRGHIYLQLECLYHCLEKKSDLPSSTLSTQNLKLTLDDHYKNVITNHITYDMLEITSISNKNYMTLSSKKSTTIAYTSVQKKELTQQT